MLKKIIKYLHFKIRTYAGIIPSRKNLNLSNSGIHETAEVANTVVGNYNVISKNCVLIGDITLGNYTTIGIGSILHGGIITIGNYCQIGPYCAIYAIDHGTEYLTTYNSKKLFEGALKDLSKTQPVSVGHGVWFGHGSVILKGVSIGNGSIVGAGAVVTKNVKPYEIVGGNPAKSLGFRFNNEVINEIERSRWWEGDHNKLSAYRDQFFMNFCKTDMETIKNSLDKLKS